MTAKLIRIAAASMVLLGVATQALADESYRASKGLLVLYDFAGKGETIRDRAGFGKPLDLRIENPKATRRVDGGLEIQSPARIRSMDPASKIAKGAKRTNGFTIEAWLRPAKKDQQGPARIVTLSKSSTERNFTLGQENASYDVRFRTNKTDKNGLPSLTSPDSRFGLKKTHVVYTRDRSGAAKVYVDGRQVAERNVKGQLAPWGDQFRLVLGDELNGQRPWLGTLFLVAIYDRPLNPDEIARHHRIGARNLAEDPKIAESRRREHFFESKIAPILSTHCLECHDTASSEGGLDLSRKNPALAGGDSGRALVPGDLDESLLWASIADDQMPQDRPPLSASQKQLIRKWIEDGVTWTVDYVDPAIYRNAREAELWVQRLTLREYIETVRTAVGVDIADEAERYLPRDKRADGFRNTAYNLTVDLGHVDAYSRLAEMVVAKMDVPGFARQFGKSRKLTDDNMRSLIADMGKWIQRGPLADHEVVVYRGITTTVASAGGDFEEAVSLVIEAMLQSPRFLYRVEGQIGDGTLWPISQYELASRMSYILWGAPPDKELFGAANKGELADPKQFQQQVNRMLDHPLAIARSRQFVSEWLNLDRLANMRPNDEKFPNWDARLAIDMRAETLRYFEEIVWIEGRPLADLLNAQFTYLTPELAKHYGLKDMDGAKSNGARGRSDGSDVHREKELVRFDLSEIGSRGGLLTHGSVLTIGGDEASMVTRGLFVLNDLLFSEVGDPPPGLDTTPVPTSPGRTHRAIATERIESVSCGGCHARFEPLAFGLEKFDGLGSFHERDEHGNELREDGEILFPGEAEPVAYGNSQEMMDLLASSDRVQQCLTRKVVQFALGRPLVASDAAKIREIHRVSQKEGGTYRSLMSALVNSDLVQQTKTERSEH